MLRSLFTLFLSGLTALAAEDWPPIPFKEVRAYAWPEEPRDLTASAVILPGFRLKPGAINPEGALLSPEQITQLQQAARILPQPYQDPAACHLPHHAFVFYKYDGKPVAYAEICFQCSSHRQGPRPATGHVHFDLPASDV